MPETEIVKNPFEIARPQFVELAPIGMQFAAEAEFAKQILAGSSYLKQAAEESPASLKVALVNVAAIGLSLSPAERLAYLIPRKVQVKQNGATLWKTKIYLEPSYVGMIKLATSGGVIQWVQANAVYEKDEFIDNGAGFSPTHKYDAFGKDRGEMVGVFCVARTKGGDFLTDVMTKEEIEDIKSRSEAVKAGFGSPWDSDYVEMAKKTVIRRAFKTWPKGNSRMDLAVQLSNENTGFEPLINNPTPQSYSVEQKQFFDQLIEKNDSVGMYLFSKSFDLGDGSGHGAGEWISLMHSFPKGQKGKMGDLVNKLKENGKNIIHTYLADLKAAFDSVDEAGIDEIVDELTPDDWACMLLDCKEFNLEPEVIRELQSQAS